ncbi:MAG: RIP metalloprotease RseP [Woeseiaceae bacterium]|nr:RIP metalloprotease RseP [Woeseiaceae bacterium]
MGDLLSAILAFVVAISVLVAVHEYGHYIVGRWCGMKVLRFSIGFGKPIWKRIGKGPDRTEYCISSIPLGGYVRFLDSREGAVDPEDEGRAFNQRPIPARIAVLLAGPFFNFLFAILAYWALFIYGVPAAYPAVGEVDEGSFADVAGLETGERIVAVGGADTPDWEATLVAMLAEMTADGRIPIELQDADGNVRTAVIDVGDERTRLTEPGLLFEGLGFRPWRPAVIVSEVIEGGPAEAAGFEDGDRIVAVANEAVNVTSDVINLIGARADQTVAVDIVRDGEPMTLQTRVDSVVENGEAVGRIDVRIGADWGDMLYLRQYGPIESVGKGIERMWRSTTFTVTMLSRMVTGDVSIKNISGPLAIAQYAGASAQQGAESFLGFLAIVSISLGVLNLLPVPVLDGGQIVYQLIEAAKGGPMSERAQIIGQQLGILALILLMSLAFYNDITGSLFNPGG